MKNKLEFFIKREKEIIKRMKRDKNNGKSGWWIVEGIRHKAHVHAKSALEAISKAHKSGIVDRTWESPEARFWTKKLPEVF